MDKFKISPVRLNFNLQPLHFANLPIFSTNQSPRVEIVPNLDELILSLEVFIEWKSFPLYCFNIWIHIFKEKNSIYVSWWALNFWETSGEVLMKRLPLSDLSRFLSESTFQAQSPTSDKFFTPCLSTISQLNLDSLHINLLEYIGFSYLMKYLFSSTLFPKRFFLLLFNLNIGNQLLLVVPTFWARKVQTVNVLFSWCWCSFSTFISEYFQTYLPWMWMYWFTK